VDEALVQNARLGDRKAVLGSSLAATGARLVLGGVVDRMDARVAACINVLLQVGGFAVLLRRPSVPALYPGVSWSGSAWATRCRCRGSWWVASSRAPSSPAW